MDALANDRDPYDQLMAAYRDVWRWLVQSQERIDGLERELGSLRLLRAIEATDPE